MSNDSPPIEQQRFARTQTPESPRPVHLPEPAKISVLLNQMDQASNDLATYNIPTDQTFAHYGDSLENPAYKSSPSKEDHDPFRDFLRQADSAVANPPEPNAAASQASNTGSDHATVNANPSLSFTNQAGSSVPASQLPLNPGMSAEGQPNNASGLAISDQTQSATSMPDTKDESNEGAEAAARIHAEKDRTEDTQPQAQAEPVGADTAAAAAAAATAAVSAPAPSQSESGVDYQSLLDNITQSASTAPAADNVPAHTSEPNVPEALTSSLPSFPGLPPKPPPLESQNAFSIPVENLQAQQQPTSALPEDHVALQSATNGFPSTNLEANSSTSQAASASSAFPNPFVAGLTNEQVIALQSQYSQQSGFPRPATPAALADMDPADRPWSPKTQAIYDAFLEDERRYVTEGIWDRFPAGSRLFVGNLPSEKVTKRDLFHRFHRHGRLAQISIKQAYGFVQYHLTEDCKKALDAEQGVEIRGRKVHLEISKPQKGSKASQQPKNQNQSQAHNRRRSRSPQRRSHSDFRDEPTRRRDEYRNRRSPSPPRYRREDRAGSRDGRMSPMYGTHYSALQATAYDDESSLPYPRRDPRYVPDVQIIVLDGSVPQAFVNWVEDGFKRKGLIAASTWLNQRTPLPAVVKRQIVEGVQAVVKLSSGHQTRSKIPLQVFDRSAGTSNVTFNEYVDLDVPIAADVIIQARQRERSSLPPRPPYPPAYPPQSPYQQSASTPWQPPQNGMQFPPPPQPPAPQHYQYPPQPQPTYRPSQPPQLQYPTPNSATGNPANLQELLANLKSGSNAPPTPQSAHSIGQPQTPYGQPPPQYPYGPSQQMPYGQTQYQQPQPPPPQQNGQPNVQYILDQMARNR